LDVAIGLGDLADVECQQGDYAAAERYYLEALQIAKKLNDRQGIAEYSGNLAGLALDREDWTAAEAQVREALDLAEKVGRRRVTKSDDS
jgi:tetratricopeptide (TPR) repeat protein